MPSVPKVRADVRPLHKAVEGGRATQGKEVHQHPRQERGRRSDVGAILALVGASFLGALTSVSLSPFEVYSRYNPHPVAFCRPQGR